MSHKSTCKCIVCIFVCIQKAKGGGGKGGTALDTRIKQEVKTTIRDEIEKNYRLILIDDTVHTIQQVSTP